MRVARADGRVCNYERHVMEEILIEHARVPAEHAVLVTEIACHRAQLADCGMRILPSAEDFGRRLDAPQRESIAGLLTAVARADGCFCALERHEIAQIAGELGIDPAEVIDRGWVACRRLQPTFSHPHKLDLPKGRGS